MPEENKIKKEDPKVDLDTSGPEVDVTIPEEKKEEVVEDHGTGNSKRSYRRSKRRSKRRTSKRRRY